MDLQPESSDARRRQLGRVLQALSAELVDERRRRRQLERELTRVRAELDGYERAERAQAGEPASSRSDR